MTWPLRRIAVLLVASTSLLAAACGQAPAAPDAAGRDAAPVDDATIRGPDVTPELDAAVDAPALDAPSLDASTADAAVDDVPAADAPTADAPTADAPTVDASTADAPVADASPPDTLPGGRRYFTAAFGRFTTTCGNNWVRLEFITFAPDGTVSGAYDQWTESVPVAMESASVTSPRCTSAACNVWTPTPFASRSGTTQSGRFTLAGDTVTISWTGGYRDTWRISRPASDVARLDFVSSSSSATDGYGFGSSYSTNRYLTLAELATPANHRTLHGEYAAAVGTAVSSGTSGIAFDGSWTACQAGDPTCLRLVAPHSSGVCLAGCGSYGDPEGTITYYLASSNMSRRNAYENYCTCLAQGGACYNGGSHVKPMLQVLGDSGTFHGWVGVEASIRSASCVGATVSVFEYTDL